MTGPDRAEGTTVLSDEEALRKFVADVDLCAYTNRVTGQRVVALAHVKGILLDVRAHLAARAALPGTADTGARAQALRDAASGLSNDTWEGRGPNLHLDHYEAVESIRAWLHGRADREVERAALAATPDGHQHAAEES